MRAEPLRGIGFWLDPTEEPERLLPAPSTLVQPRWLTPDSRVALLNYLRSAPVLQGSWGFSWCRFKCGVSDRTMGSKDYWDGVWVWPEGLAHYIECHDVCLPHEFVQHALSTPIESILPVFFDLSRRKFDLTYWIGWADQFRRSPPAS